MFATIPGESCLSTPTNDPSSFSLVNLSTHLLVDRAPNSTRFSPKNVMWALFLLTFTAVVFRAEVAILLAPLALQLLYNKQTSIFSLVQVGLFSGLFSLGKSI